MLKFRFSGKATKVGAIFFLVNIVNFCAILKIYELQGNIQKDFDSWKKVALLDPT